MVRDYQRAYLAAIKNNIVKVPSEFTHRLGDFKIVIKDREAIIQNKSIDSFRKTLTIPVVKYVDAINGNDSNSGNSLGSAYKTLSKLLSNLSGVDRVYFSSGNYAIATASSMFSVDREIISLGGSVVILRGYIGSQLTWTSIGNGVFSAPLIYDPKAVLDDRYVDSEGDLYKLSLKTSISEVTSTAGSYWRDAPNNIVYIHLLDDTTPTDHFILSTTSVPFTGTGNKVYTEGITFLGLSISNATATETFFLAKNCKFIHNYVTNSLNIVGNVNVWVDNCLAAKSNADGFNYHGSGIYNPNVVENYCVGRNNGVGSATGTNNGSTSHESCVVLRLNGNYVYNEGPCVADVNNAKSLNVCCISGYSVSSNSGYKSAYCAATTPGETTKMWLYMCSSVDETTYGAENRALATSTIFTKRSNIINIKSGTVLTTY